MNSTKYFSLTLQSKDYFEIIKCDTIYVVRKYQLDLKKSDRHFQFSLQQVMK